MYQAVKTLWYTHVHQWYTCWCGATSILATVTWAVVQRIDSKEHKALWHTSLDSLQVENNSMDTLPTQQHTGYSNGDLHAVFSRALGGHMGGSLGKAFLKMGTCICNGRICQQNMVISNIHKPWRAAMTRDWWYHHVWQGSARLSQPTAALRPPQEGPEALGSHCCPIQQPCLVGSHQPFLNVALHIPHNVTRGPATLQGCNLTRIVWIVVFGSHAVWMIALC